MINRYMEEAFLEARKGLGQTSPNPAVGAVLARNEKTVGRGFHTYSRKRHAETIAIEEAGELARDSTLYVTLEPCSHQGRTGPCTAAILAAGIGHVVVAMEDPNPLVSGSGIQQLREAGVTVEIDPEGAAAGLKLNEAYIHFMRRSLPLVLLKSALTLDGKIAAPEDNRGWITSDNARAHVQTLRHSSDAIMTGIGTVLADNCMLTDRSGQLRSRPLMRVVVDSLLRLPIDSKMVQSCEEDLTVVTTSAAADERRQALEERGVKVLVFDGPGGRTDLASVVSWLAQQKYLSLMIEAGSKVNWTALESGIVDKIFFYYAPKILGGLQSLPVAGGAGRKRRVDAIVFRDLKLHSIACDEFAVEAYLET